MTDSDRAHAQTIADAFVQALRTFKEASLQFVDDEAFPYARSSALIQACHTQMTENEWEVFSNGFGPFIEVTPPCGDCAACRTIERQAQELN